MATPAIVGLEPQDYGAAALQQAVARASQAADPAAAQRLEQALTDAMQRYLGDLHRGRIDPGRIHHHFTPPRRDDFDAAATLRGALATQRRVGFYPRKQFVHLDTGRLRTW